MKAIFVLIITLIANSSFSQNKCESEEMLNDISVYILSSQETPLSYNSNISKFIDVCYRSLDVFHKDISDQTLDQISSGAYITGKREVDWILEPMLTDSNIIELLLIDLSFIDSGNYTLRSKIEGKRKFEDATFFDFGIVRTDKLLMNLEVAIQPRYDRSYRYYDIGLYFIYNDYVNSHIVDIYIVLSILD